MEELELKSGQKIPTNGVKVVQNAKDTIKTITDLLNRSKAYYNALAAISVEDYLSRLGFIKKEIPLMRSSSKLLVDYEVADVRLPNLHIDVRAVFDEEELFIPKKHFENNILPDIYLFVKFNQDLTDAEFLGFVSPKSVNEKNSGDEYYFVNKSVLTDVSELPELIEKMPVKKETKLSGDEKTMVEKLIMLYEDNDILPERLAKLLSYLNSNNEAREKLIEFESFERLSYMALQEFKDLNVENNDFSKYIKTLVAADEFAKFNSDDMTIPLQEENNIAAGLFVDEETQNQEEVIPNTDNEPEMFTGELATDVQDEEVQIVETPEELAVSEIETEQETAELSVEDLSDTVVDAVNEDADTEISEVSGEVSPIDEFETFEAKDEFDISEESLLETVEPIDVSEEAPLSIEDSVNEITEDTVLQENKLDELNIADENEVSEEEIANVEENVEIQEESLTDSEVELQEEPLVIQEGETGLLLSEDEQTNENSDSDIMASEEEIAVSVENIETPVIDEDLELNIDGLSDIQENSADETVSADVQEEITPLIQEEEFKIDDEEIIAVETADDNVDFGTALTEDDDFLKPKEEVNIDFENSPDEELNVSEALELNETGLNTDTVIGLSEGVMDIDTSKEDDLFFEESSNEEFQPESVEEDTVKSVTDSEIDAAIVSQEAEILFNADDEISVDSEDSNNETVQNVSEFENPEIADNSELSFITDEDFLTPTAEIEENNANNEFNVTDDEADSLDNSGLDEIISMDDNLLPNEGEISEQQDEGSSETDFAFALDSSAPKPAANKKLIAAITATAIIGLAGAGGAYFMSQKNKPVTNDINISDAQTSKTADTSESEDFDIDNVIDGVSENQTTVSEDIKTPDETAKEKSPDVVADIKIPAQTPQAKDNKPAEALTMQKIKRDFSQPNTYLSVSKVVWGVPEYLTYNDDFSQYLQRLGSMIKINLSNDLLLVTENPVLNSIKVKIMLTSNGSKFDVALSQGCGAKAVDDLVLQSVKNAMNAQKPPVSSLDTADEELILTIQL